MSLILAIDTSCDDTSVAVTQNFIVISNVVSSQVALHQPYGGVFPTVAKLAHQENISACVDLALKQAGHLSLGQISAIAVTQGPGLAPALEVGLKFAQDLAREYELPLIPINHIEAHAWSPLLAPLPKTYSKSALIKFPATVNVFSPRQVFPVLSLVVSGGHTQLTLVGGPGQYQIVGSTLDDAAGECLDKIGRLLNLGYPAGPVMEELAKLGDPARFQFPLPLTTTHNFDFSFSGLKTFARNLIKKIEEGKELVKASSSEDFCDADKKGTQTYSRYVADHFLPIELCSTSATKKIPELEASLSAQIVYDLCASAQAGVFRHLTYKLNKLLETSLISQAQQEESLPSPSQSPIIQKTQIMPVVIPPIHEIWLGGGVAANVTLRHTIRKLLRDFAVLHPDAPAITLRTPYRKNFCGDNAAMVGAVAALHLVKKNYLPPPTENNPYPLDRQPNLPLTSWQ